MSKCKNLFTVSVLALTLPYAYADENLDQDNVLDVVIIDASKRSIAADKVDSAVVVKTAEELEQAKVTQVQDLEKVFPGLLIRNRGNRTYSSATIRGISSPDFYSPSVQIYVDGVPQDSAFLTQELINVDYVELLRGPQGTLYGGNAQGGIINIVTRKGELGSKVSATFANSEIGASLSNASQISDDFYVDINIRQFNEAGDIDHISSASNTSNANDSETLSVQARLHYLPEDSPLELTFSIGHDELDSHEEWYLSAAEYAAGETNQSIPVLEREVNTYALSVDYDLGNSTLTSITSFQEREIYREYIGGIWSEDQGTFNQEVRISSLYSNGISSLIGANYKESEFDVETGGFPGAYSVSTNTIKKEALSLFGEVQIPLADDIDLTTGLRVSYESTDIDYSGRTGAFAIDGFTSKSDETLLSPKVSIGWQANEDHRLYSSYTRGYRPGGFSYSVGGADDENGVDAETTDNVELGWRWAGVDNRLFAEASLYWIQINDIQLNSGPFGSQSLKNFGEAESKGIEFNLGYEMSSELSLNLGGTLGQSRFKDNDDLGITDNNVPYAPDTTLVAGFTYDADQIPLSLSANMRYYSQTFFDEINTLSQDAYTLVDASATYRIKGVDLKLYVKNLTDEEYVSYLFSSSLGNYGERRTVGLDVSTEF